MDEQERNAIAYALLKVIVKEDVRLREVSGSVMKRKAGILAQRTGISPRRILEFAKILLREVFEEQMKSI